jgi:hypothetical protein
MSVGKVKVDFLLGNASEGVSGKVPEPNVPCRELRYAPHFLVDGLLALYVQLFHVFVGENDTTHD